jgi:hypothetical protein
MIKLEIILPTPWAQCTFDQVFADLAKIAGYISEATEEYLDDRRQLLLCLPHPLVRHLQATKYNGPQNLWQALERALHPGVIQSHPLWNSDGILNDRADLFYTDEPGPPIAQLIIHGI